MASRRLGSYTKWVFRPECVSDTNGLYAIAATNENGDAKGLLIANVGAETTVETNLESGFKVYEIDEKHMFAESPLNAKSFVLGNNKVVYLEKA